MESFHQNMLEYRKQLEKGAIQGAYRGLMQYMLSLKNHFSQAYPDCIVSGSPYIGYMDMTYFSFSPKSLKERSLKVAIVFVHEAFRFEAWLAGVNKRVQTQYWNLFREHHWDEYPRDRYRLVPTTKGADAIVEHVLVAEPDFRDLAALTVQIEQKTLRFITDIESFLVSLEMAAVQL